jgi:transposase-like protein
VAADALTMKVREGGRVVKVHVHTATGTNADGHREILGVDVTSAEDGANCDCSTSPRLDGAGQGRGHAF